MFGGPAAVDGCVGGVGGLGGGGGRGSVQRQAAPGGSLAGCCRGCFHTSCTCMARHPEGGHVAGPLSRQPVEQHACMRVSRASRLVFSFQRHLP